MRHAVFFLAALVAPSIAQAQAPGAQRVEVVLANFSFTPAALHLKAGRPVTMHFVNQGSGGHNYSAPEFFGPAVPGGKVELKKGESRDVALTPRAGHYDVRCTHFLHTSFGMKGTIDVE